MAKISITERVRLLTENGLHYLKICHPSGRAGHGSSFRVKLLLTERNFKELYRQYGDGSFEIRGDLRSYRIKESKLEQTPP